MKHEINSYHNTLKAKINEFVHLVYKLTKKFPKEELYGVISQIRRAVLSVMLNYVEGYARGRNKVHKNFLEISYGSSKEVNYLLEFSLIEEYINKDEFDKAIKLGDEIGAMLWGVIRKI